MMMKHLLTAIACFFALSMSAQFPYNPDSNSDNVIGVDDLMGLLPLYGGDFYPVTANAIVQEINVDLDFEGIQSYQILEETDVVVISHDSTDYSWCNTHIELILPFNPSYKELTFMPQSSSNGVASPVSGFNCFPTFRYPNFHTVLEQGEETVNITTYHQNLTSFTSVFKLIRNPVSNAWLRPYGVYESGQQ